MATSSECTYVTVHTEKSFIEWDYTICVHLKKKKRRKKQQNNARLLSKYTPVDVLPNSKYVAVSSKLK